MGGGPAGLYSAILLKQAMPRTRVEVHERNKPDDTFGWGVVFSDQTMAGFAAADAPSHAAIVDSFYHWDDIDVHIHGESIRTSGRSEERRVGKEGRARGGTCMLSRQLW